MKMLNRLVNIIILILAIATVGISFLLYQKREQLVKGWAKMGQAINGTSVALDKGSGTDYAKKLNAASLNHKHYSDLDKLLPELAKQSEAVIQQRGALSSALAKVGNAYELPKVPAPAVLNNVKDYKKNVDALVSTAENYAQINNNVLSRLAAIGDKVGVNVTASSLRGESAIANAEKITGGVNTLKVKADTFAENFGAIASVVGANGDFNSDAYQNAVVDTVDKVKGMKPRHDKYLRDWKSSQEQVKNLAGKVNQKDTEIKSLSRKVTGLERQLSRYTRTIESEDDKVKIDPNDPKLLRMIKGRIIDINSKWDFVVLNLGSQSKVEQKSGNKVTMCPVNIPANEEMVVVRGLDTDKPEYIGKVKIVQVNDNCSIANIQGDANTGSFKVGDVVFFSKDAISNLQKKKAVK